MGERQVKKEHDMMEIDFSWATIVLIVLIGLVIVIMCVFIYLILSYRRSNNRKYKIVDKITSMQRKIWTKW
jgi:heme/copper-type cytochrome/quinol oxidase subunit 2